MMATSTLSLAPHFPLFHPLKFVLLPGANPGMRTLSIGVRDTSRGGQGKRITASENGLTTDPLAGVETRSGVRSQGAKDASRSRRSSRMKLPKHSLPSDPLAPSTLSRQGSHERRKPASGLAVPPAPPSAPHLPSSLRALFVALHALLTLPPPARSGWGRREVHGESWRCGRG